MSNLFSRIYGVALAAEKTAITTFHAAEAVWDSIVAKVEAVPGVKPVEEAVVSSVKQEISNALAFVDTELAPHFGDAVSMVESAIDTGMLAFGATLSPTGEIVVKAATPAVNAGATLFFNQLRAVIDHAEADFKASANLPAPTSATAPSVASIAGAIGQAATVAITAETP